MLRQRLFFVLVLLLLAVPVVGLNDDIDCEAALEIWEIQGAGEEANCLRDRVRLEDNLVTATGHQGFFMQTPAARSDDDPTTSDGVYVLLNRPASSFGVQVGDRVTVDGRVKEFFALTQIEVLTSRSLEVLSFGNPLPDPIDLFTVELDWTVGEDVHPLERYEGMYVQVEDAAVVAPTNYFDEFGVSLVGERPFREPGVEIDWNPEFADRDLPEFDLNPELIEVDPAEMGLDVEFVTSGSHATVTGGLAYSYRDYQIWPSDVAVDVESFAVRPVRAREEGEFTVATQNMANLFDMENDPRREDSPLEDYVPDQPELYTLRLQKMSAQVRIALGAPDIVAIQEIENARVLTDLAFQIAADDPSLRYAGCFQEGNDDRGIDNAYLVRTDRVNLLSCYRLPGSLTAQAPLGGRLFGRPPLVLEAEMLTGGGDSFPLTLINLHNKSLSGAETERVQLQRLAQAQMVATYVQGLQEADPDAHIIVLGDLNAFEFSDGLVDVVGIIAGTHDPDEALHAPEDDLVEPDLVNQVLSVPAQDRYSYIYNSTSQVLDHILTSAALNPYVVDAQFSRGNADALYVWEYEANGALRSSDHDGMVLYLNPDAEE